MFAGDTTWGLFQPVKPWLYSWSLQDHRWLIQGTRCFNQILSLREFEMSQKHFNSKTMEKGSWISGVWFWELLSFLLFCSLQFWILSLHSVFKFSCTSFFFFFFDWTLRYVLHLDPQKAEWGGKAVEEKISSRK